jgi:hypothetical protein
MNVIRHQMPLLDPALLPSRQIVKHLAQMPFYLAEKQLLAILRRTPSGTTPSHTSRHRAMRSLRAKATIMGLRAPRAFSVRAQALSFW